MSMMISGWEAYKQRRIKAEGDHLTELFSRMEKLTMTPIERIAFAEIFEWLSDQRLMDTIKLETQKKFGPYYADFYLSYSSGKNKLEIVVECDGHEFHEKTKTQASRDKRRDRYFTKLGIITLRYSGSDVVKDPFVIVQDIEEILMRRFPGSFKFG